MKDYMFKHYQQEERFEIAKYIDSRISCNTDEIRSIQDELLSDEESRSSWRNNQYLNDQIEILEVKKELLYALLKEIMK